MCELDAMIYSDARKHNITVEQTDELHHIFHEEHNNGEQPKNLIDLLEGIT